MTFNWQLALVTFSFNKKQKKFAQVTSGISHKNEIHNVESCVPRCGQHRNDSLSVIFEKKIMKLAARSPNFSDISAKKDALTNYCFTGMTSN